MPAVHSPSAGVKTPAGGGDPSTTLRSAQDDRVEAAEWVGQDCNGMVISAAEGKPVGIVMADDVKQLGRYLVQMGQMLGSMQKRLDELEEKQKQVTVSHWDVKRLQALIRMRGEELCGKYQLTDKDSGRILRAAIKKDLKKRFGVADLHDLPEKSRGAAENAIGSWVNIRLVMERRSNHE